VLQLRRSVLACLLWESQFYEDGVEIAGRIAALVPKVAAEKVAALAVEGRGRMKLGHAPLLLVREMARHKTHRALVSETLARIIQRADELAEFVAIYWKDGRVPLSGQVKKGLAELPSALALTSARLGSVCFANRSWAHSLCFATFATCARPEWTSRSCSPRLVR
jgi:hypothetical protein